MLSATLEFTTNPECPWLATVIEHQWPAWCAPFETIELAKAWLDLRGVHPSRISFVRI